MKKINFFLLFAAMALTSTVRAQVINGDLNHNDVLDVGDVTLVIDGYLTGETEMIDSRVDPFLEDNSRIAGTWYKTKKDYTIYNEDGTFGNMGMEGYTYKFLPYQGRILVFAPDGQMQDASVLYLTDERMYLRHTPYTSGYTVYFRTAPPQLVEELTIAESSPMTLHIGDKIALTLTVGPADADNPKVEWASLDENVATVEDGVVTAVGVGSAIITCTTTDGSGLTTFIDVTVRDSYYEAVDLGLSVKWATMNIGASSPEDYGDYFAWGETEPKDTYNWSTYKWCNGSYNTQTKYCTSSDYGTVDNKTVLDLEDDAARANWGGTWRMPTKAEQDELCNNCTWTWTTQNGVNGYKVTSKTNGNSIFLPAAGYRFDSSLSSAGSYGDYWSSSLNASVSSYACHLDFDSGDVDWYYDNRYNGRSVRAVCQ
ncbi:MAG: Ig-like domain-containing protein [Bacteroidaceae bacterium]|nr:Ig-like domain-containing protein [Bacteroidaceae bacterium]